MADKMAGRRRDEGRSNGRGDGDVKAQERRPQPGCIDVPTSSTPKRPGNNGVQRRRDGLRNDGNHNNDHTSRNRSGKILKCSTPIRNNSRVNEQGKSQLRIKKTLAKRANMRRSDRVNKTVGENVDMCDSRVTACRDLSVTLCDTRSSSLRADNFKREPLKSLDNCFVRRAEEDCMASGVSFIYSGYNDNVSLTTDDTMITAQCVSMAPLTTYTRHGDAGLNRTTNVKRTSRTCPDLLGEDEERTADFLANVYQGSLLQIHGSIAGDDHLTVRWC